MKILYLTNVPSPYRVDFFNELGKHCDLTVLFEKSTSNERNDSWKKYSFKNFKGYILKGKSIKTDSALTFGMLKFLRDKSYDRIICTNFSTISGIIAIEYMRLLGRDYYLESDGGFAKNGSGIKEKFKKHIISGAKGYFSTAEEHDKYYIQYGAPKEKIHRYPFTSLFEKDIEAEVPDKSTKLNLRKKLDINEDFVVITVGRFSYNGGYGKGLDTVIKSAAQFDKSIGFYLIGDKPTEEFIEMKKNLNADNVHFIDFKNKADLKEYYKAADLFVLMTRGDIWGLVINEAMSNGLPVITTNRCIAGLQLVNNGENGYIIGTEDVSVLTEKINSILFNGDMECFSNNSLKIIKDYTIEAMCVRHMEILNQESERN